MNTWPLQLHMACAMDFRDGAFEDQCVYERSQAGAMEQSEEGKGREGDMEMERRK